MNLFVYLNPPSIIRSFCGYLDKDGPSTSHLNFLFFIPPGCRSGFMYVSVYICCTYKHHVDDDDPHVEMALANRGGKSNKKR